MNHPQNSISLWKDVPNLKWLAVWPAGTTLKKNIGFYAVGMHAPSSDLCGRRPRKIIGWEGILRKIVSCLGEWFRISKDFFIFANEVGPWNPTFCDIWAWFKKKLTLQIGVVPHQMTVAFFCQLVLQLEISSRDLMEKDGQQQAAVDFIKSSGGWWLAIGGTMVPSRMFCFRRWNDMGILRANYAQVAELFSWIWL